MCQHWCVGQDCLKSILGQPSWKSQRIQMIKEARYCVFEPISVMAPGMSKRQLSQSASQRCSNTFTMRSEEHTSELQSLMRISYAVFCLKKKPKKKRQTNQKTQTCNTHNLPSKKQHTT